MKKRFLSTAMALAFLVSMPFQANAGCDAGGVGSTSCSLTEETEVMGIAVVQTATVSCGSGYYACCSYNPLGTNMTANCKPNKKAAITAAD